MLNCKLSFLGFMNVNEPWWSGYRNIILIPGHIQTSKEVLVCYTQGSQPKILFQGVQGKMYILKLLLFKLKPRV